MGKEIKGFRFLRVEDSEIRIELERTALKIRAHTNKDAREAALFRTPGPYLARSHKAEAT